MVEKRSNRQNWGRQWLGVIGGAIVGFLVSEFLPDLANQIGIFQLVLWCAILGGMLASLEEIIGAGAVITRRQNRWVNLIVGLVVPALLLGIVWLLIDLIKR
jgi:hypothetical protein